MATHKLQSINFKSGFLSRRIWACLIIGICLLGRGPAWAAAGGSSGAEFLKLTAPELKKFDIIDNIIPEPLGGAQNDPEKIAKALKSEIMKSIDELRKVSTDTLVRNRIQKFMKMGRWSE